MPSDKAAFLAQVTRIVGVSSPGVAVAAIVFRISVASDGDKSWPQMNITGSDSDDRKTWIPEDRYMQLPVVGAMPVFQRDAIEQACIELVQSSEAELIPLVGTPSGRRIVVGWDGGEPTTVFTAIKDEIGAQ